jgi:hypothetical protein
MRQVVYAIRFTGHAAPASADGGVLTVMATAPSATTTSTVGPDGLGDGLDAATGDEVTLASEVTITGATSFHAVGMIGFGSGHRLRVAAVASGYLAPGPDAGKHGAVVWRVEGGEGQFAGARGLITSNFLVGADLAVTDHHLGVLFVP